MKDKIKFLGNKVKVKVKVRVQENIKLFYITKQDNFLKSENPEGNCSLLKHSVVTTLIF